MPQHTYEVSKTPEGFGHQLLRNGVPILWGTQEGCDSAKLYHQKEDYVASLPGPQRLMARLKEVADINQRHFDEKGCSIFKEPIR